MDIEMAFKVLSMSEQALWKFGYSKQEALDTIQDTIIKQSKDIQNLKYKVEDLEAVFTLTKENI